MTSPAAPLTADDRARAEALSRMKLLATGLFGVAAVVFLGCVLLGPDAGAWVGYVRATAEASMVGALADWFAVTALFRHPLRIPIPHTAIIPRRKDEIGESLGVFVQSNFLTRSVLVDKLQSIGVAGRVGAWMADPEHARRLGDGAAAALSGASEVLRDEDVQALIEQLITTRIRSTPAAPVLAALLEVAIEDDRHQEVLGAAVRTLRMFLIDNRDFLRRKLGEESPDWVPAFLDDRIFAKGFSVLLKFLGEVGDDPDHELRQQVDVRLRDYVLALRTDPTSAARVELLKEQILDHPAVQRWMASLWGGIKRSLLVAADDPTSELRVRMEELIVSVGRSLHEDPALAAKVDAWAAAAAGWVVDHFAEDIAELVSGTVARWDAVETSNRIELQVGRDLQFIRINGTVVGGLAGLVIYSVAQLIS